MTHDNGEINQDSSQDQSNMIKDRLLYLCFCDADAILHVLEAHSYIEGERNATNLCKILLIPNAIRASVISDADMTSLSTAITYLDTRAIFLHTTLVSPVSEEGNKTEQTFYKSRHNDHASTKTTSHNHLRFNNNIPIQPVPHSRDLELSTLQQICKLARTPLYPESVVIVAISNLACISDAPMSGNTRL
jgi:hypothetical protein